MNFPFFIARRYLFSKKSQNVINIISGIAMTGIGVGTLALVVVLSALNGLEGLVESLYSSFDPDITITASVGKTFDSRTFPKDKIHTIAGLEYYSEVLEETVFIQYRDNQAIAKIKGVEQDFIEMSKLDNMMVDGELLINRNDAQYAVLGYGVADKLGVFISQVFTPMKVYAVKRNVKHAFTPDQKFKNMPIVPGGIFSVNPDYDFNYVLVPLDFAKKLLDYEHEISAVEIGLLEGENPDLFRDKISQLLGEDFEVKTRYQLNELLFKTNKTEKWVTYMILTFILVIATFNVIGSLTMLIIDKKEDINILKSMGATQNAISQIFWLEGMLIAFVGGGAGLILGVILCLAQKFIGLVRLEDGIVDFYPVELQFTDLILVSITVMVIGFVASWFPVRYTIKRHFRVVE